MFGFFNKSKIKTKQKRDPKRYEKEKEIAESADEKKRISLAKNSKTHQEILYYLAEKDPSVDVRKAVAENASTPLHVSTLLAEDSNIDVRMALAGRLVDLLPDLDHDKHSQLYAYVVQALGTLALDEVLKIRKALSSALKDHAHAPPAPPGIPVRGKLLVRRIARRPVRSDRIAARRSDVGDLFVCDAGMAALHVPQKRRQ